MNRFTKLISLAMGVMLVLAACGTMNTKSAAVKDQKALDRKLKAQTHNHPNVAGQPDAAVIPSVDRNKNRTTNQYGTTTHGMGTSVYSVIGSSGLHSQGLSSHLESRLSGEGISDVKVLAFGDMVILAAKSRKMNATQYDPLQQKLLSPTGGLSAKGPEATGRMSAKSGEPAAGKDNLAAAEQWIRDNLGSNVQVQTVVDSQAVDAINKICAGAGSGSGDQSSRMADEIQKLLQLVAGAGKKQPGQ
ncbi:hypothetical protein D7Z26_19815 [Cohnella endophytica]|uniref:Sporulation protein n=1 Tax=Cohnella endophytica TaxID=2419778 RepID=A0A494XRB3_9BACL|nr:hypothetical protein [Cohnella endophytica]RKP50063.1 hypothetical protein D7Z26_19815 [Cohnella endophytica]